MPKKAKRNIAVPASVPAASKKPVKPVAVSLAVPAGQTLKQAASNPANLKPMPKPVIPAPVAAKPVKPVTAPDTQPRGLTRDAAGIVRYATNFNQYSGRDEAYLAFFGNVMRANSGKATLRQIHDAGITRSGQADRKRFNPNYTGSGKATDVGAINRLCKAGYFTRSPDGNTISATPLAVSSKAYSGKA